MSWLTPVYDLFARLFMPEKQFKRELIVRAHLAPGQSVLDLGAGTGTLAIMVKQAYPDVKMAGIDGDPEILAIARKKASRAGVDITFEPGNVTALPYPDGSFDRALSSLVMSLLSTDEKKRMLQESYRVLRRGGELHIADFGRPRTSWERWLVPLMRNFDRISDNLEGRLPSMLQEAGFEDVDEVAHFSTAFGTISIISALKSI